MVQRDEQKDREEKAEQIKAIKKKKKSIEVQVFYCAWIQQINAIINRVPLNWFSLKVLSESARDKRQIKTWPPEERMTQMAAANRLLYYLTLPPLAPAGGIKDFSSQTRWVLHQNGVKMGVLWSTQTFSWFKNSFKHLYVLYFDCIRRHLVLWGGIGLFLSFLSSSRSSQIYKLKDFFFFKGTKLHNQETKVAQIIEEGSCEAETKLIIRSISFYKP